MSNTFLTIIIPVYNVEKYIDQCLNSVVNQTLNAHKVIVVNDGTKDRSGEIARRYAEKYPDMITYIEQENQGLGAARNVGLKYADTPYVTFLDSDDWLMPRYVEHVCKRIEKEPESPQLIYTLPCVYDMATGMYFDWMDKPLFEEIFNKDDRTVNPELERRMLALEPNACRKVYLTSFLRKQNFSFPEGTKWEDVEPHFQLLHAAKRCIGIADVGFCYRINSGNQITAGGGPDRLQIVSVFSRCLALSKQEKWERIETSYILRMLLSFAKWSIDVASIPVRKQLAYELHGLYRKLSRKMLRAYYEDMHVFKNDRLLIALIRSPFYKVVGVSQYYALLKKLMYTLLLRKKGGK